MTIRTFALAGAAALALSMPAMAATHHRAVSSDPAADAAEARITAQLNQQTSSPGTVPSVATTTAMTTGTAAPGDNSAWASQQTGASNAQAPSPGGSSEPQAKGPNEEEKTVAGTQSSQPATQGQ